MISEGKFKIFGSHSRDLYGMPGPGGKCVLIDVEGLDNLSLYFQNSYGYMCPRDTALLFEVKAVKLSTKAVKLSIKAVQLSIKTVQLSIKAVTFHS